MLALFYRGCTHARTRAHVNYIILLSTRLRPLVHATEMCTRRVIERIVYNNIVSFDREGPPYVK